MNRCPSCVTLAPGVKAAWWAAGGLNRHHIAQGDLMLVGITFLMLAPLQAATLRSRVSHRAPI